MFVFMKIYTIFMLKSVRNENSYTNSGIGLKVITPFSCSNQLSMKFIMFINVKMPTIVVILTFISMINTASESLKVREVYIFLPFSVYEQLNFHAQLSCIL